MDETNDRQKDEPSATLPAASRDDDGGTSGRLRSLSVVLIGALAVAVIVASLWQIAGDERYATRAGEMGLVVLPDGSLVMLNTSSVIEVAFSPSERRISLFTGEALFDIAHDADRPLKVEAPGWVVQTSGERSAKRNPQSAQLSGLVDYARDIARPLTGSPRVPVERHDRTKFTVHGKANDRVQVIVLDGAVHVRSRAPRQGKPTFVGFGTMFNGEHGREQELTGMDPRELEHRVAWLQRQIYFDRHTVAEAAAEISRYSELQIILDSHYENSIVSGRFYADDPIAFVELVEQGLGIRAVVRGNAVTLSTRRASPEGPWERIRNFSGVQRRNALRRNQHCSCEPSKDDRK